MGWGMTISSPLRPSQVVSPLVSRTRPRSTIRVASPGVLVLGQRRSGGQGEDGLAQGVLMAVDGGGTAPAGAGSGPFQLFAGLCV